jgi:CheY-like chemotaxis protein
MSSEILNDESDSFLDFAPEEEGGEKDDVSETFGRRILVVDDDEDVHLITKVILKRIPDKFKLQVDHAYSGGEAMEMVQLNPSYDLVLLDVVMEDDDSGFKVARYIRLDSKMARQPKVIIRSGQPGISKHDDVLEGVALDGFYEKTELDSQTLLRVVLGALEDVV